MKFLILGALSALFASNAFAQEATQNAELSSQTVKTVEVVEEKKN